MPARQQAYEAYVHKAALEKASTHARELASKGLESMGLLVGEAFSHKGRPYVIVEDYVTAGNDSTAVSVRFSREAFSSLAREYSSKRGRVVVGWCHSHPNYGCFLSSTDVRTQKSYFPEEWHIAIVIDPLRSEAGAPLRRVFKLKGSGYEEAAYAVIERK